MIYLGTMYARMQDGEGFWGYHMMPYGYGSVGWLFMIIFLILLIGVIVYAILHHSSAYKSGAQGHSAMDILRERYARGEINKEEFEQKKKDLS